ncbi:hypothetical protein [Actinoplanes sp. NPDC023714]|uniref:hypothetical protein n=1 Tax=Actinoplanes sp. NPDC023714 TaxID=3154322 RepID=UPI0033F5C781
MIESIEILPPLGFGRVGPSRTPCDGYTWGPNDLHPRGTGKTTIRPAETLAVAADGTVTGSVPATVTFKDATGWRPVAPFFELHGRWTLNGRTESGPLTADVLAASGLSPGDLRWRIEVANLKAFHYTLDDGDRVAATLELRGDDTAVHPLPGVSPSGAGRPLVPAGRNVPLGAVQVTRPTAEFPELRIRFTPAAGNVYGPADLPQRSSAFVLPADRLILDPQATWCGFRLTGDPRTNPGGLFAGGADQESLGLVDDVCDGLIRCTLPGVGTAVARIVVGPPDFAPDRRPFTSIADGLTDRVRREDVHDPSYVADEETTTREVQDLLERVLETMENVNVDAQNDRARAENAAIARARSLPEADAEGATFDLPGSILSRTLPLTEAGRQRHRRFLALEVMEDLLREQPDLIDRVVRAPATDDRYYDRRMPAMMRGSDRYPMHLTRRQFDLLQQWARQLRSRIEEGT